MRDVKKFGLVRNRRTAVFKKLTLVQRQRIKKNIPARKRSFMARMGGVLKKVRGQKSLSPAFWSLKAWRSGFKI